MSSHSPVSAEPLAITWIQQWHLHRQHKHFWYSWCQGQYYTILYLTFLCGSQTSTNPPCFVSWREEDPSRGITTYWRSHGQSATQHLSSKDYGSITSKSTVGWDGYGQAQEPPDENREHPCLQVVFWSLYHVVAYTLLLHIHRGKNRCKKVKVIISPGCGGAHL